LEREGADLGKIAAKLLATGDGWNAADVVCSAGPQDRPFEEQHSAWSIAVVLRGSFQYHLSKRISASRSRSRNWLALCE
jgi:AraC family transcriptional regulator